jgi:hypothetical protein
MKEIAAMTHAPALARRSVLGLLGATIAVGATSSQPALAEVLRVASGGAAFGDSQYAGLAHYQFEPRRADDVVAAWENGVLAAARQWPGFVEGRLLLDRLGGTAIAFGVFATKGDADAFGATEAFRAADARLASLLLAPPVREEFEVFGG